jgi:hypothetical protein
MRPAEKADRVAGGTGGRSKAEATCSAVPDSQRYCRAAAYLNDRLERTGETPAAQPDRIHQRAWLS